LRTEGSDFVKLKDWLFAAALTLIIVCGIWENDKKYDHVQKQIQELNLTISQIQAQCITHEQYITKDAIAPVLDRLASRIDELDDRVYQYKQDICFWNEHVEEIFGAANARYFREGRGK